MMNAKGAVGAVHWHHACTKAPRQQCKALHLVFATPLFNRMPPKRKAPSRASTDEPPTVVTRRSADASPRKSSKVSASVTDAGKGSSSEPQPSYEDIRRLNIAKIQLEMQHIGLSAAAAAFVPITTPSRPTNSAASRGKKSAPFAEPLRMSLRTRDGETKPKRDIYSEAAFEIQEQRQRWVRRAAPFAVDDCWYKDLGSSEHESRVVSEGVFAALRGSCVSKAPAKSIKAVAAAEFYGRMRAHSSGYGKLVPDRIYSICMHPSHDSVIGFVGDKFGETLLHTLNKSHFFSQANLALYTTAARPTSSSVQARPLLTWTWNLLGIGFV